MAYIDDGFGPGRVNWGSRVWLSSLEKQYFETQYSEAAMSSWAPWSKSPIAAKLKNDVSIHEIKGQLHLRDAKGRDWPIAKGTVLDTPLADGYTISKRESDWRAIGYAIWEDTNKQRWAVCYEHNAYAQFPISGQASDPNNPPRLHREIPAPPSETSKGQAESPEPSSSVRADEAGHIRRGYDIYVEGASGKRWAVKQVGEGFDRIPLDGQGPWSDERPVTMHKVNLSKFAAARNSGSRTTEELVDKLDAAHDEIERLTEANNRLREILAAIAMSRDGDLLLAETCFIEAKDVDVKFKYDESASAIRVWIP